MISSWQESKEIGDRGERIAAGLIRREWRDIVWVQRIASTLDAQEAGDLRIIHKSERVWCCEIKTDLLACETGRLAIETARKIGVADSATGLSTSTAQAWGFLLPDRLILALPDELRALLAAKRADGTLREARAGDGKRTLVALVEIGEVQGLPNSYVIQRGGQL